MKSLSFYYELLSFDRDIMSLVSNPKSIHVSDIITLSLGIKVKIEWNVALKLSNKSVLHFISLIL